MSFLFPNSQQTDLQKEVFIMSKNEDLLKDVEKLTTNPNSSNMISNRTSKDGLMMTVK